MPLTDEEMARKVAREQGGTWAPPIERRVETRDAEVIEETPRKGNSVAYITQIPPGGPLELVAEEYPELSPVTANLVQFVRREWAARVWVTDRDVYDAEENVLSFYGHWRVHRFTVWVRSDGEGD